MATETNSLSRRSEPQTMQHDCLVEGAQVVDVARDDGCAFSTCREDDGSIDHVRCLPLAAEDPNGFGPATSARRHRAAERRSPHDGRPDPPDDTGRCPARAAGAGGGAFQALEGMSYQAKKRAPERQLVGPQGESIPLPRACSIPWNASRRSWRAAASVSRMSSRSRRCATRILDEMLQRSRKRTHICSREWVHIEIRAPATA